MPMTLLAEVPPMIGGYSVLGIAGLAAAGYLGVKLLRAIRNSGDL